MEDLYLKNENKNIISIVSTKSSTGKTTLIEKLIKIFKAKGYTVGVLKHDAHKFEIDKEGKDSYRFTKAGADTMIISSNEKLAMVEIFKEEKSIEDILKLFGDLDIIIIEGFKKNSYPKIEVHRKEVDSKLLCTDNDYALNTFIAVASNEPLDLYINVLDLDDPYTISEYIEERIIRRESNWKK